MSMIDKEIRRKTKMVKKVTMQDMEGDTYTTKKLNALLTMRFVSARYVQTDECLVEATHILNMPKKNRRGSLHKYLDTRFGKAPIDVVNDVITILKEAA